VCDDAAETAHEWDGPIRVPIEASDVSATPRAKVRGLAPESAYAFAVSTVNAVGEGPKSAGSVSAHTLGRPTHPPAIAPDILMASASSVHVRVVADPSEANPQPEGSDSGFDSVQPAPGSQILLEW